MDMFYQFTDVLIKNLLVAEELHKPITSKFKKQKIYSSFIGNIGGPDLADIQLIGKSVKEIRFYICVIDIFSKYAWIISLKDTKSITIADAFQRVL